MAGKLPQPSGSFRWVQVDTRPALVCRALEGVAPHLFTTRLWPLGVDRTDHPDDPWSEVARGVGIEVRRLVRARQVHGAAVVVQRAGDRPLRGRAPADIILSNDGGAGVAVEAADCVPLLIADRRTGAVAAAHAGWRGLAAGVPRVAIEALVQEFGSCHADLVAAAGPSIGACCYEVGGDVRQAFEAAGHAPADLARWFRPQSDPTATNPSMPGLHPPGRANHWYFDSWASARDQLALAGVPQGQIFVADLCTASHPAVLCSYRRDGPPAGRLAAVIRARPPALHP